MPARFDPPKILLNGDLRVTGPFTNPDPDATIIGDVHVRFLLIQKLDSRQTGTPWMIEGLATCPAGATVFEAIVGRSDVPAGLAPNDDARAIGTAVAVMLFTPVSGNPPAPPVIETLTWCVDVKVAEETASP